MYQQFSIKTFDGKTIHFPHIKLCKLSAILSPVVFSLNIDDLSVKLNECKTGCMVGNLHDDLVILSPYSPGLQ